MIEDQSEIEKLLQAHAELQVSLHNCHELVADLRSKLAANGNEPRKDSDGKRAGEDRPAG